MVSPIVYIGGKHLLRRWVLDNLPGLDAAQSYVELFLGAGHVFFELWLRDQAGGVRRNYVLNDLDGEVVNFFRQLRDRSRTLINKLRSTPYSRAEFNAAWTMPAGLSDLERARRFFIRVRQGVAGKLAGRTGWGRNINGQGGARVLAFQHAADQVDQFVTALRGAYIEHLDFAKAVGTWDSPQTVFYADPPYVTCESCYRTRFVSDDHRRLADLLTSAAGRSAVSYYPHDLVKELYPRQRWTWITRSVPVTASVLAHGGKRGRAVECLIVRVD